MTGPRKTTTVAVAAILAGCTSDPDGTSRLAFLADPGSAREAYRCFGFDADDLHGADIGAIELDEARGPIALHHVALYASPSEFADGPVDCVEMPEDAVPLHVWATGGAQLALPHDIQLAVPDGTRRFVIQTHALRVDDGEAVIRRLKITPRRNAAHRAGWLPLRAPTPALRPHHLEESATVCSLRSEIHIVSTWPHMHRAGSSFHGAVVRASSSDPFVIVDPWSFDVQRAYPVDVTVAPADMIETRCIWRNDTDETILPGPSISQEMCGQSLIAWPVEAAHCE